MVDSSWLIADSISGCRMPGEGCRIQDAGYWDSGCRIPDTRYRIPNSEFRIQDTGYTITWNFLNGLTGKPARMQDSRFKIYDPGFR
jgi:hypothetical protein